jgi:ubiquinone biosynthesis protein UbiJ
MNSLLTRFSRATRARNWPRRRAAPIASSPSSTCGPSFDVPALVAEVRRLRAQVRALEEHVARLMATDKPDRNGEA